MSTPTRADRAAPRADRAVGDRLARLLNLVPYLLARPGILVAEAAADLGRHRTPAARGPRAAVGLRAARLRPGRPDRHGVRRRPGHDHLRRRHRPTAAAHPGRGARPGGRAADARRDAGRRTTETRSSGRWRRSSRPPGTPPPSCPSPSPLPRVAADRLADLRGAVQRRHALRITYYTATRDELTERVVDPMRVRGGRAAGPTWRRGAAGPRRSACSGSTGSTRASELDEPAAPPPQAQPHDVSDGVFTPSEESAAGHAADRPVGTVDHGVLPVRGGRRGVDRALVGRRCARPTWAGPGDSCSSLGPDVTVVAPPALAEAVRAEARTALANYDEGGGQ